MAVGSARAGQLFEETTMTAITDMVQEHLGDGGVTQLTQHLGVDPSTAQAAAAAALPMLVNAMSNRAPEPGAAGMPDVSGGGLAGAAGGLLGNLFGGNHAQMSQQVSQHSGLDIHQAEKALLFLAPIVMAQLARKRQEGGAAAAPSGPAPSTTAQSGPAPAQGQVAPQAPAAKESALGSVLGAVERIFHGNK
jgi:hypothetical protein